MKDLIQQLQAQISSTSWDDLDTHYERDALIVISPAIDLAEAAANVAKDDKEQVAQWLEDKKIYKPSQSEVDIWKEEDQQFNFLIIQPFVLVQLLSSIH